jgi:hypothetical protein
MEDWRARRRRGGGGRGESYGEQGVAGLSGSGAIDYDGDF